jgi:hypothetical protein
MKFSSLLIPVAMAAAFHAGAYAQAQAPQTVAVAGTAPGGAMIAGTTTVTAKVVAIDLATRTASLKGASGKILDVEVPPEAKNFDKVKVGDLVRVTYSRALTLQLNKAGNGIRESQSTVATAPAPAGAVAGGAIGHQLTILANVLAVDRKAGTVTLRGPKGDIVDLTVPDPAQLKLVKKGDQVQAVYTEAVAITVERATRSTRH